MGLFGPIWLKSSLEGERMKKALDALRKITDQQKLKEAVLKARYREIKETALDRITDEKVLQEIFKVGTLSLNDSWIRFQIIRRSEDQGFLYAFASDLGNGSLGIGGVQEREAAINRLNDPDQVYAIMRRAQELSRKVVPVFQSGMRDIGAVASQRLVGIIDQTTDKKVLLKYLDSQDEYARKAASRRARELSIPLPEAPKAEASESAVDKKDKPVGVPKEKAPEAPVPEEVPDIIMTSDSYRRADAERAVWALTSQKQIAQAARKAPLPRVRLAAVRRLEDQEKLKSVALHDKDYEVREMAAKKLTNPALIRDFVLKSDNINLVRVPLRKLEETDIIAVAREGKHLNIRVEAIGLIHDQDVLSEIALSGGTEGRAAMEKLQDTDALKRVYEGTADMNIKAIAIEKCGGYLCSGCGAVVWPSADVENPCACPACGTMNHHWEYVDDVTEYRDYSVGTTYDRCTRCGERKNVRHINTL